MSESEFIRERNHPFEKSVKFKEEEKQKITESPIMKASPCELQKENLDTNIFYNKYTNRESHPMTISSLLNPMQTSKTEKEAEPSSSPSARPPLVDLSKAIDSKTLHPNISSHARIESQFVSSLFP